MEVSLKSAVGISVALALAVVLCVTAAVLTWDDNQVVSGIVVKKNTPSSSSTVLPFGDGETLMPVALQGNYSVLIQGTNSHGRKISQQIALSDAEYSRVKIGSEFRFNPKTRHWIISPPTLSQTK